MTRILNFYRYKTCNRNEQANCAISLIAHVTQQKVTWEYTPTQLTLDQCSVLASLKSQIILANSLKETENRKNDTIIFKRTFNF